MPALVVSDGSKLKALYYLFINKSFDFSVKIVYVVNIFTININITRANRIMNQYIVYFIVIS